MIKNTASQKVGVQMISATDGTAFTSAVTVYVTVDAGTQAVGTVSSGACTHEGNGYHTYAPSQAETNGDLVAYTFIGTGAVPQTVQLYTVPSLTGTHLTAIPWNASWDAEVQSEVDDAIGAALADSIPADGSLPSLKQAVYMITQYLLERSVSGTTVTIKKVDGSTTLFTETINDSSSPTSITRTT